MHADDPDARPAPTGTDALREIEAEHAAIFEVLRRIELELDRLLENPALPGGRWELPDLARECRDRLASHFVKEEGPGLLASPALPDDPETRRTVGRLIVEHRDFERRIRRIVEELNTGFVPGQTVQGLFDGELRRLIDDMVQHEALEAELMRKIALRSREGGAS